MLFLLGAGGQRPSWAARSDPASASGSASATWLIARCAGQRGTQLVRGVSENCRWA